RPNARCLPEPLLRVGEAHTTFQLSTKGALMDIVRHEIGPRMSQANIHNGVVYLAGQIGEGDTVKAQTEAILAQIDRLLALSNSSKERILSAQIWLADMSDFAEM